MLYDIAEHRPVSGANPGEDILSAVEYISQYKLAYITKGEAFSVVNILSGKHLYEKVSLAPASVRRILPMAENSLYVFGMLAAIYIFHEQVSTVRWLGILLIMAGCYLIAK